MRNKINRAAAETASGHSGADDAFSFLREFDHNIELGAAHFEIVAQTGARFGHQFAGCGEIVAAHYFHKIKNPLILTDDMFAAAKNQQGKIALVLKQLGQRNVSQRRNLWMPTFQQLNSFFALSATRIVLSAGVFVFDHGVANDEAEPGWKRHRCSCESAAV